MLSVAARLSNLVEDAFILALPLRLEELSPIIGIPFEWQ